MAENLNYKTTNSWWYDNSSANGDIYGRLYTWDAAMQACPSGWHLPSDDKWNTLEMALGMSRRDAYYEFDWRGTDEGKKMKSTSGWYYRNGTNSSGFNALPGGCRPIKGFRPASGSFYYLGSYGYWWSSTEVIGTGACRVCELDDYFDKVDREHYGKSWGFSVRCVKD